MPQPLALAEILKLFHPKDALAVPLATGQPIGLLQALSERSDWERLQIFTGLLTGPFPIMMNPNVYVMSGYYGPIERLLNENNAHMEYLPANFRGLELFGLKKPYRVVATVLSLPDKAGYCSFGTHGAAIYKPFIAASRDPERLAIAELNPHMPVVYGDPELGDNKIHIDEIDACYDFDQAPLTMPDIEVSAVEKQIAGHVLELIESKATLQFGIGGVPDEVANRLAESSLSDFGVHSELISDGFTRLFEAGKISNRHKGQFDDQTVFTFAFGHQELYDLLDERKGQNNRQTLCLPVSSVNDPALIAKNKNMISINSGLMVDFAGQVCSEAIGLRQYSGVGGQLSFVQGAYGSDGGKTIICIKSTVDVDGEILSNISPTMPEGSLVSTPRHYTQYIVTEYGIADLYGVSDERRAEKLIAIAHPDFRDELSAAYERHKQEFYKI